MRQVARWYRAPWAAHPNRPSALSNNNRQVTFHRPGEEVPKHGHGTIDYNRRLWQHSSSKKGIGGTVWQGCFSYGYDDEWLLIREHALWIEYQDRATNPWKFYRISVPRAQRLGRKVHTPNGDRWLVPLGAYQVTERRVIPRA